MAILTKKPEAETKYEVAKTTGGSAMSTGIKAPVVLIQPRVSEKAGHLASQNKYVFKVKTSANKIEVKKAIEGSYKVKVVQVNIVRNQGKNRTYGRASGRTSDFKKAIVTLKKGDTIEGLTETV